jgi:hypothetical protein
MCKGWEKSEVRTRFVRIRGKERNPMEELGVEEGIIVK